jgi:hypothetical protein
MCFLPHSVDLGSMPIIRGGLKNRSDQRIAAIDLNQLIVAQLSGKLRGDMHRRQVGRRDLNASNRTDRGRIASAASVNLDSRHEKAGRKP